MSQRHEMHKCEANRSIRTKARTTALPVLPVPRGRSNKGLRFIITANQHNSTRVQETSGDQTPLPPLFLALHLQTALLLSSPAKYPNSAFLSPATLPHHLRTHPLLMPLPLISQSSPLPQNPKSTRSPIQLSKQAI